MCGTESDYRYRGATQAAAEDGGLLAKLTFPQYSGTALQGRQCVSGKGAVTPSKVSVKPQGGLGFGGSETQ
jgi:hypothetical protein